MMKEATREKFTTTLKAETRYDLELLKAKLRMRGVNDVIEHITELYLKGEIKNESINKQ